ncbi:MAG: glutamate--tRNA ligase [Oligoflexales bacterium]|nr:glutamate--tRNA ligase [Oligoflexales bacterium]
MSYFNRVRVRVAPSPTGDPHVGTAYMTLFNYVFAKKHGGDLILRIEDTDQSRAKPASEKRIMDSLKWLGLAWDEGPDTGGPYGPYYQSQRLAIYSEHVQLLLDNAKAYRCFCTSERLDAVREQQKAAGQTTGYDRHCRNLSKQESDSLAAKNQSFVVRLKMPIEGETSFHDEIRGEVKIDNKQIDDQVLMKSDGFPTYHLANVVDDHLMKISHVIRAEEWISSTPKHVILYEAFGWEKPNFAHFPLLRNSDRSKISKRKSPVSIDYFRRKGILPQALVNFLGLMGWSFGNDVEVFTVEQMLEKFEFKGVHLGGPIFDMTKLAWLNHQYMQRLSDDEFAAYVHSEIFNTEFLKKLRPLALDRMQCFEQFVDNNSFFFNGALDYRNLQVLPKGMEKTAFLKNFKELLLRLDEVYTWDQSTLEATINGFKDEFVLKPKDYFMPLRLMITGRQDSPPLVESMVLVGREMTRFRLREALNYVQTLA